MSNNLFRSGHWLLMSNNLLGLVVGNQLQGNSNFFDGRSHFWDSILTAATAVLDYQHVSYTIIIIYYFITWILNSNISHIKLRQIFIEAIDTNSKFQFIGNSWLNRYKNKSTGSVICIIHRWIYSISDRFSIQEE